jgi:predicted nucleic acid-binding protein
MTAFVVDASVILKWVLPENISPLQDQALSVRDAFVEGKIDLIAPSLWRYEVGNTLGRVIPEAASELFSYCCDIRIREAVESLKRDNLALDLMKRWQVTFYDASYHALAIENDLDFITADEKYSNKLKQQGNVLALKDWVP